MAKKTTTAIVVPIAMLMIVSTLVPDGIVVPCALTALSMLSWFTKINVITTEYTASTANSPAAASCIGRVQGVGSRLPGAMGIHCWPAQRNWASAETRPAAAGGFVLMDRTRVTLPGPGYAKWPTTYDSQRPGSTFRPLTY